MKCKSQYKDLNKYRNYRNRCKTRYRARTGSNVYEPREWTKEELRMVQAHKITDRELSKKINRSVAAIQNARYKLKKGIYNI